MLGRKHQHAHLHSIFYRDKFRRTLRWLLVNVFIMLLLIIAVMYLIFVKPAANYYANTTDGRILPMPAPQKE